MTTNGARSLPNLTLAVVVAVAALACGRDGAGTTTTTDPLCAVSTARQPPFVVTFRFQTDGASPVYVHQGCIGVAYDLSACASGYAERLGPDAHCACECEDATCTGPVVCGTCYPEEGEAVMPGAPLEARWGAFRVTDDTKGGFACVHSSALPAGKYRVAVRVFDDEEAARTSTGGRTVTQDFDLPAPGDTVAVALGGP